MAETIDRKIRYPKVSSLSFFEILDRSARGPRLKTHTQHSSRFFENLS